MARGAGRGGDDDVPMACYVGACCGCVIFLTMLILFAVSFQVLGPLEMGIDLNKYSQELNEEQVFGPGRYVLGIGHTFLNFPSTLQSIEFSEQPGSAGAELDIFTNQGQTIFIDVSFQYRLVKEELIDLYYLYGKDYESGFIKIAQSSIKETATLFDQNQYYTERELIAAAMEIDLRNELRLVHANVTGFQLRDIELLQQAEDSIIRTLTASEAAVRATFEQQVRELEAEIDVIAGGATASIQVINAEADANAFEIREKAVADAIEIRLNAESNAMADLQSALGFNSTDTLRYLYSRMIRQITGAKLLIGLQNVNLNLNP